MRSELLLYVNVPTLTYSHRKLRLQVMTKITGFVGHLVEKIEEISVVYAAISGHGAILRSELAPVIISFLNERFLSLHIENYVYSVCQSRPHEDTGKSCMSSGE